MKLATFLPSPPRSYSTINHFNQFKLKAADVRGIRTRCLIVFSSEFLLWFRQLLVGNFMVFVAPGSGRRDGWHSVVLLEYCFDVTRRSAPKIAKVASRPQRRRVSCC